VSMYKASDEHGYVRQPVVTYLTVASEQPGDVGTRATKALTELEELDPEGVKQARSLMAFGALARARAASSNAAAATRPADSTTAAATTPANDATETGPDAPGEFPDPANYVKDGQAKPDNISAQANGKGPIARVAAETTSESDNIATLKYVAGAEAASPGADTPEAGSPEAASPADVRFNRALAIGVPLAAALLLMGVYWLILRAGAL
jgi:hypothetical protein